MSMKTIQVVKIAVQMVIFVMQVNLTEKPMYANSGIFVMVYKVHAILVNTSQIPVNQYVGPVQKEILVLELIQQEELLFWSFQ